MFFRFKYTLMNVHIFSLLDLQTYDKDGRHFGSCTSMSILAIDGLVANLTG